MLSKKYEAADLIHAELAQGLYENYGIVTVVTDGKYVQIEKEKKKLSEELKKIKT